MATPGDPSKQPLGALGATTGAVPASEPICTSGCCSTTPPDPTRPILGSISDCSCPAPTGPTDPGGPPTTPIGTGPILHTGSPPPSGGGPPTPTPPAGPPIGSPAPPAAPIGSPTPPATPIGSPTQPAPPIGSPTPPAPPVGPPAPPAFPVSPPRSPIGPPINAPLPPPFPIDPPTPPVLPLPPYPPPGLPAPPVCGPIGSPSLPVVPWVVSGGLTTDASSSRCGSSPIYSPVQAVPFAQALPPNAGGGGANALNRAATLANQLASRSAARDQHPRRVWFLG